MTFDDLKGSLYALRFKTRACENFNEDIDPYFQRWRFSPMILIAHMPCRCPLVILWNHIIVAIG